MIRINDLKFKATLKAAVIVGGFLLLVAAMGFGQQQVNLAAAPTTTTLPDGSVIPMWGYFCGTAVTGSTASCAALNPASAPVTSPPTTPTWSPVVITVPTGQSLTINLTNNLSFTPTGGTANTIPTSIVIVGQVGGGLGVLAQRTTTTSPDHSAAQNCVTWFIADTTNTAPGVPCPSATTTPVSGALPPAQGPRVQSFSTEVAAGATTSLTWSALRPGTYLLESGTHPSIQVPMGLIGVLVVTTAPVPSATAGVAGTPGTAYPAVGTAPAVTYGAELPMEFSEIDPVQNKAVNTAVNTAGFSETAVWSSMHATAAGPLASLSVTSGGSGYSAPLSVGFTGGGGSGAAATATLSFEVASLPTVAVGGTGYSANDVLTFVGGTGTAATATVGTVDGSGVILTLSSFTGGSYTTAPTSPIAVTGGTGSGATLNATFTGFVSGISLTNVGTGYTSAPIVQVTGGTGTGAVVTAAITLGGCGTAHTCYPPAVNYTPFYYLINGVAFNKTAPAVSLFQATAGTSASNNGTCTTGATTPCPVTMGITGPVLARLVNAGLRMHVPSIVGSQTLGFTGAGAAATVSGFTLIAEDGNPVPGVQQAGAATVPAAPRVQTDVFMAAGKTFDVLINAPQSVNGAVVPALPIYDRELSLSANSSARDAGMLAYISVNNVLGSGTGLPTVGGGLFAAAVARADTYDSLVAGKPFTVSDPSKGVIANDTNVYGVTLFAPPTAGTLTCPAVNSFQGISNAGICANGTFTYTPNSGSTATSDTFTYCANNGLVAATTTTAASCSSVSATVTLGASSLTGNPSAIAQSYTAKTATYLKVSSPGLLLGNTDPNNLALTVVPSTSANLVIDQNGGFWVSVTSGTASTSFSYTVQNSQGRMANGTATVSFPTPNGPTVTVVDAQAYNNCNGDSVCISKLAPITDYRWIIEEDKTFWVDPNCTTTSSINVLGCPSVVGPAGTSTIPTQGVQFHTSTMDYVAQGCTGPKSCEGGQTFLNPLTGTHDPAVCDVGNGACRLDPNGGTATAGYTEVLPRSVHLDPSKRYYISVLPGDAGDPFPATVTPPNCDPTTGANPGNLGCGHTMGGAQIPPACNVLVAGCTSASTTSFAPVTVLSTPTPLPTGKLSLIVFEDDFPLNGEQDAGGGIDVLSPNEPGLGGFEIILWDTYGSLGDVTGQDTHDMFNMPLSNSLAGTIDPATGLDACPISTQVTSNALTGDGSQAGITGRIVTCPKYESDNATLSPLAGQAVVANLMADKFSVQAYPGADRIARGEEWLQTNTLDGQHPHDSFIRIGEPSYFQEYGPAGYHVSIGFANPKLINDRHDAVCAGSFGAVGPCNNTIEGQVDVQRLSRTPDQRLYPSGSRDALAWTQCWVSLGDPDAEDFMFTKCDANGNFKFTGVPGGNWRLTIGDQWNDQIIDGLSTPANVGCVLTPPATTCPAGTLSDLNLGPIGVQQWQANVYTRTFVDDNKNGIRDDGEIGIPLVYTMIHYRDGSRANVLTTDFDGVANFNETFPLFNWYVVTADSGRYKTTGIHTVYDAGGPADGTTYCGNAGGPGRNCGTSTAYNFLANTFEAVPLPADLSVPGAVYCASADCKAEAGSAGPGATPTPGTFQAGTAKPSFATASTGRIDPPWVAAEGWSGETSQGNWIEFGKAPFANCNPALPASATNFCVSVPNLVYNPTAGGTTPSTIPVGENGGIHGLVKYAATRPFDDASQMIEQPWAPNVARVTINLYQEGFAADGATSTLKLVDTTQSTSWDDWAQGFYPNSTAGSGTGTGQKPYMSCPGQGTSTGANADLFFFTLFDQPNYLNYYNSLHGGPALNTATVPYNSQFKCYDAMHIWNQIQPAPYDGMYSFPSSLGVNAMTGKPLTVSGCVGNAPGTACPTASTPTVTVSSLPGTNCTVCVKNPDTTDVYRVGTPMLPPGKYVVEVIMPPGYEVEKEEDKNLLIGDNYVAPATQQFSGLGGSIFIMPDQASVASMYDESASGYNPTNYQNATTNEGNGDYLALPGYPGFQDPIWPCVGEQRVVPDYLSLFPQVKETAPFAGATRPLCDRKEVTLASQDSVSAKFYIFTSAHIASHFTGVITDDFTSEFDPFAPQFGEKFSPPNMPISTRDYLGNEVSRVYSDHWGIYDGLTFSSWDVNPPNITGYSPSMMVQCMNDYGPIRDTNLSSPTYGQMINDPLYNSAYSDFCYTEPYMPGTTTYLDTPVVPTQAFVGAGYNNPDCAYPDATPAIAEVDGDGIGPWVSAVGHPLTITALGNATVANASSCTTASTGADVTVNNFGYAGPSASVAPFDCKTVTRHYGFGSRCSSPSASSATCNTMSSVTIGGVPAIITSWSDTAIRATVAASGLPGGPQVPLCTIQQQVQYGGSQARCGQLVITAGNGKQSVDTVTVTIGGKAPTHVAASGTIQGAIDAAAPGDLIIVDPTCTTGAGTARTVVPCTTAGVTKNGATHTEMVLMWKPVRLQGAGAASTIINANTQPAGKILDPWRRHINCLFGLTLQGVPYTNTGSGTTYSPGTHPYDPNYNGTAGSGFTCPESSWQNFSAQPNVPQIDRLPLEATVGWDATLNGNLAELLQEPSLMGAYEGAGITVLGKGLDFHGQDPWGDGTEPGAFPAGTTLLTGVASNPGGVPGTAGALLVGDANPLCHTSAAITTNPFPSNYVCNPSSIDGLTITNSSQGGGGIFVHGWAHFLQIANNRVYNNAGTLSGGISVGQGEFAPPYIQGGATNAPPGSCSNGTGLVTNQHLPMCLQLQPNVHNNMITDNSSIGDELFSATLSGGGGVSFCTGNDYYKFNYNWVCGNISAGEGGGLVHLGEIYNGDIEHNSFVFNESSNPTIPTNGGGIQIQGTPDTDPVCGTLPDADCPPGLSDGTGPGLVINANLIQGNSADSGSGGGIRLQQVNGSDVSTFPTQPNLWHGVTITNNIINNNMAGWDGAGISLQDALNVQIINNTIAHNDTLASSGVLTQSIGTPQASGPAGNCTMPGPTGVDTASCPQSAGVTSTLNSSLLTTTFVVPITCPTGSPNCTKISDPILANNIVWQNRSFHIGITGSGTGQQNQQNLIALFNAGTNTAAPTQTATGSCSGGSYWDLGVRGDHWQSGVAPNHDSGFTLNPTYSVLTNTTGYPATNSSTAPPVVAQYCNGSRVPPECTAADGCGGPSGFGVPPGIPDSIAGAPRFSLVPSATVDEGNNWINVSWGPLALTNPTNLGTSGNYGGGAPLANYALTAAIDNVPVSQPHPPTDFFGNARPETGADGLFDPGAVEFGSLPSVFSATLTPSSWTAPTTGRDCPGTGLVGILACLLDPTQTFTLTNTGTLPLTGIPRGVIGGANTADFAVVALLSTCGPATTLAPGASCVITVQFRPQTSEPVGIKSATLSVTDAAGTQTAQLAGTSTLLGLLPLTQDFGTVPVAGTATSTRSFIVANSNNAAVPVGTVTFSAPDFTRPAGAAGGTCGANLGAGSVCTVIVRFKPQGTGLRSATMTVPNAPQAALTGTGQ